MRSLLRVSLAGLIALPWPAMAQGRSATARQGGLRLPAAAPPSGAIALPATSIPLAAQGVGPVAAVQATSHAAPDAAAAAAKAMDRLEGGDPTALNVLFEGWRAAAGSHVSAAANLAGHGQAALSRAMAPTGTAKAVAPWRAAPARARSSRAGVALKAAGTSALSLALRTLLAPVALLSQPNVAPELPFTYFPEPYWKDIGPLIVGVQRAEDLARALEILEQVSPAAATMIADLREKNVRIELANEGPSRVTKSLYRVLNRDTAYGTHIAIRKRASLFEIIHELAHAVAADRLPAAIKPAATVKVDVNQDEAALREALLRIGYLEEGVAFSAEAVLMQDLEKAGFKLSAQAGRPEARKIYEEGGVEAVAEAIPRLEPAYADYYGRLAAASAPALKGPRGALAMTAWGDKLSGFGVDFGADGTIKENAEKALRAALNALLRGDETLGSAFLKLAGLAQRAVTKRDRDSPPPALPPMAFPQTAGALAVDFGAQLDAATPERIRIAGGFLDFLEKSEAAEPDKLDRRFTATVQAAKRLDGARAAEMWAKLYALAATQLRGKPERMKELGLALIEAGDQERGMAALRFFLDHAPLFGTIGELIKEFAEHKRYEIVAELNEQTRWVLGRLESAYHENLMKVYREDGQFSPESEPRLAAFWESQKGRHVSAALLHEQILELWSQGLYKFSERSHPKYPPRAYEQSYLKNAAEQAKLARMLVETAEKLPASEAPLASQLAATAEAAAGIGTAAALQSMTFQLEEWAEDFGLPLSMGYNDFMKAVQNHPNYGGGYLSSAENSRVVSQTFWYLNQHQSLFPLGLAMIERLPDTEHKLTLYQLAAQAQMTWSAREARAFASRWRRLVKALLKENEGRIISEGFWHTVGSQKTQGLLRVLLRRAREAQKELGLKTDDDKLVREFIELSFDEDFRRKSKTMTAEQIWIALYGNSEQYEKSLEILQAARRFPDPVGRLQLILRLARMYGMKMIPEDYVPLVEQAINEALAEIAAQSGQPARGVHLDPPADELTHFHQGNEAAIARFLMRRGGKLAEEGRARLTRLSAEKDPVLSFFERNNSWNTVFEGKESDSTGYADEYAPAEHKLEALLAAAQEHPAHRDEFLAQAQALETALSVDFSADDHEDARRRLILTMQRAQLESQAGRGKKAASLLALARTTAIAGLEEYRRRLAAYDAQEQKKRALMGDWDIKKVIEAFEFLLQETDSRQKALLARDLWPREPKTARALVDEVLEAFEKDVSLRRDRFQPRSMVASGKALEKIAALQPAAIRLYELAIEKLALERGNKELFEAGLSYFVEKVDQGALADAQKDRLLLRAVDALVPPKERREGGSLTESLPGLLKIADIVDKAGIYPKTEAKILAILADEAQATAYDREDWTHEAKLLALSELFARAFEKRPGLGYAAAYDHLAELSAEPKYQEALSKLFPAAWKAARRGDLTRESIRAGAIAPQDAEPALLAQADAGDLRARARALALLRDVQDTALPAALTAAGEAGLDLAALALVPGVKALLERLGDVLAGARALPAGERDFLETLLEGGPAETARAKMPLFRKLLADPAAPIEARRLAFQGLIAAGIAKDYAEGWWNENARGTELEPRFYEWIERLLSLKDGNLPDDRLLSYLFENPGRAEKLFATMKTAKERPLLFAQDLDKPTPDPIRELEYFRGTASEYQAKFQALATQYDVWVPNMFDETELLVLFEKRFHWLTSVKGLAEMLRAIFVHGTYDIANRDIRYSVSRLEQELAAVAPRVRVTPEQRLLLNDYFKDKNMIPLANLEHVLGVEFTESEKSALESFLDGDDRYIHAVIESIGFPQLTAAERARFKAFLTQLEAGDHERAQAREKWSVRLPKLFEGSAALLKDALTAFFRRMPFGEREAILKEFDETSAEEQAVARLFAATGNEKLGQFLSIRRDLVPERFRKALEKFQENVEASAFDEVRAVVEQELGGPLERFFSAFEKKALKVGTIGEVYTARLHDDSQVVVKVITPSKRKALERNLDRLKQAAEDLHLRRHRYQAKTDFRRLFEEFDRTIREELDLRIERRNAEAFSARLEGAAVPRFHSELTRQSVLVQSFAQGVSPVTLAPAARKKALKKLSRLFFGQIMKKDLYHEDLHPGNIRVAENGAITLLDFGRIGRLNEEQRGKAFGLMRAAADKNVKAVRAGLESMGEPGPEYDASALERSLAAALERGGPMSTVINALLYEAGSGGLRIESTYIQLVKALLTFEGMAQQLDSEFDLEAELRGYVVKNALAGLFAKKSPSK